MGARRRILAGLAAVLLLSGLMGAGTAEATTGLPSNCTLGPGRLTTTAIGGGLVSVHRISTTCTSKPTWSIRATVTVQELRGTTWTFLGSTSTNYYPTVPAVYLNAFCTNGRLTREVLTFYYYSVARPGTTYTWTKAGTTSAVCVG